VVSDAGPAAPVLGIETSCDETAAAVVVSGRQIRSSIVSSQVDLHARFGGVVPELASRAHLELVGPVIAEALGEAATDLSDLAAVAACRGPGLAGAVLVVSGGHTLLVTMQAHGQYRVVGQTVDDAAGEAFDKVARHLGLGYPGGPAIDALARQGNPEAIHFPRAMPGEPDFSFAGLKTAVVNHVRQHPDAALADVAASFQAAVVDQLVDKLAAAADEAGAPTLVLGGGVAANSALRERVSTLAADTRRRAFLPAPALCTDNGAMIAGAAWWRWQADGPTPLTDGVDPALGLPLAG